MKAIKAKDTQAEFRFWGGDLMQQVGGTLVKHYRDLAFMGFLEVLLNLRTILKNITLCKEDINAFKPDVLIFIDYPGFNMRIAHGLNSEVFQHIITFLLSYGLGKKIELKQSSEM